MSLLDDLLAGLKTNIGAAITAASSILTGAGTTAPVTFLSLDDLFRTLTGSIATNLTAAMTYADSLVGGTLGSIEAALSSVVAGISASIDGVKAEMLGLLAANAASLGQAISNSQTAITTLISGIQTTLQAGINGIATNLAAVSVTVSDTYNSLFNPEILAELTIAAFEAVW